MYILQPCTTEAPRDVRTPRLCGPEAHLQRREQGKTLFQSLNVAYRLENAALIRLAKNYQNALAVISCFSDEKRGSQQSARTFHNFVACLRQGLSQILLAKRLISVAECTRFGKPKFSREHEWRPRLWMEHYQEHAYRTAAFPRRPRRRANQRLGTTTSRLPSACPRSACT